MKRKLRFFLTLLTLLLSGILLGWAYAPPKEISRSVTLSGQADSVSLAPRQLTVRYPPKIRLGDSGRVTLRLDAGAASSPSVYEKYTLVAQAKLEAAGAEVSPPETIREAMPSGKPVLFYWHIRPPEAKSYQGTLWLFVEFIPKNGAPSFQRAFLAKPLEVEGRALWGLSAPRARLLGSAGALLSLILGFRFLKNEQP